MTKLFVSGFPLDISELALVQLFGFHADIETIKIVRDKKTRVCKGYAFLEIANRKDAENAVEALDNTPYKGRMLSVKIKEEDPFPPMNSSWPEVKPKSFKTNESHENISPVIKPKRPRKQS